MARCIDYKNGPKVQFRATCVPTCGPQLSTCQKFIVPRVDMVVGHLHTHIGIPTDTCRHANGDARGTCQPSNAILHGHMVGGGWSGVVS
jgi:hypothetical protein